jgi:hypothetical protein
VTTVPCRSGKQGLEDGDLVGLAVHLALGSDQAGCGHRGEQVDLSAVGASGTAHGLAVHCEGGQGPVAVVLLLAGGAFPPGEPTSDGRIQRVAVDALEDPAHGGLGWGDGAAVRLPAWATEPSQDVRRGVGGPLRDRSQRLRSGQDSARGQGQDEGERMASALVPAGVGHLRQAGQQAGGHRGRSVRRR